MLEDTMGIGSAAVTIHVVDGIVTHVAHGALVVTSAEPSAGHTRPR
ncbi:hypothetical protein [Streptomyces sp. NPDC047985]